ncbi:SET domain-containing protein 5 [Parachaetomium inaequale]|uniref:SET domain-containing protein 5 n=1 Tax=Parachaetomium inaequale TaxID=2588326 RepID=A0AAN6SQ84_9PEZI|nr:SET domain-containing protein 5 [Parachaetomium inaequale]
MAPRRAKRQQALVLLTVFPCLAQAVLGHGSLNEYSASTPLTLRPLALDVACPLPVDDNATHPPECEHSTDTTAKYCANTNSRHGPRGWSIITTPETAANSVSFLNQHLNTSRYASLRDTPYKLIDVPGKGKGLVATRPIKQYEEILLDYATLLVDIMFTTKVSAFLGYRLLHAAVDRLSDPASVLELGQSNGYARDSVENILRTNAFGTLLGGVPHIGLYPMVSVRTRMAMSINHACKPNIGAARDIPTGEEITISYIPLGLPTPTRAQKLQQWDFTCHCPLYTARQPQHDASDARRREIDTLRDHAMGAFQAGRPYQALRLTRQVLALLPAEELFPLYSEQYENMARVFYVLRDMENAEKYARLSLGVLEEQGYVTTSIAGEGGRGEALGRMWRRFEEEEEAV